MILDLIMTTTLFVFGFQLHLLKTSRNHASTCPLVIRGTTAGVVTGLLLLPLNGTSPKVCTYRRISHTTPLMALRIPSQRARRPTPAVTPTAGAMSQRTDIQFQQTQHLRDAQRPLQRPPRRPTPLPFQRAQHPTPTLAVPLIGPDIK